jgi:hypothetical protein
MPSAVEPGRRRSELEFLADLSTSGAYSCTHDNIALNSFRSFQLQLLLRSAVHWFMVKNRRSIVCHLAMPFD